MAFYQKLNQLWRLLMTGLLFVVFGMGALLLGNLWMALVSLLVRTEKRQQIGQYSIHISFKVFVWLIEHLGIATIVFEQRERLLQPQACLLVANHPTLLDYVLLGSVLPKMDCIVKEALFRNFFCKHIVKAAGYIPNQAPEQLLADCQQRLAQGARLLVFPEGTRSVPGQPMLLQRGSANLAIRCEAPIRPVYISCQPILLSKQQSWYQVPACKPIFHIKVAALLPIEPYLGGVIAPSQAARHLTRDLTTLFETHVTR